GVLAVPSLTDAEAAHFGRRAAPADADAQAENADVVDVIARLWDSWEGGAIIRDEATGRFIDRVKVHYVDFEGGLFSVKGPPVTPGRSALRRHTRTTPCQPPGVGGPDRCRRVPHPAGRAAGRSGSVRR